MLVRTDPAESQASALLAHMRSEGHASVEVPGSQLSELEIACWRRYRDSDEMSVSELVSAIAVRSELWFNHICARCLVSRQSVISAEASRQECFPRSGSGK